MTGFDSIQVRFKNINFYKSPLANTVTVPFVDSYFEILKKDEESLGIIFTYLMLETILLGKVMKLNPFDQPAVESIKKETKRILS